MLTRIHFSTMGNDTTGDGSLLNPYQTVGKANSEAADDTELVFEGGETFAGTTLSLTNLTNVRIGSYGIGIAILDLTSAAGHGVDVDGCTNVEVGNVRLLGDTTVGTDIGVRYDACTNLVVDGAEIVGFQDAVARAAGGGTSTVRVVGCDVQDQWMRGVVIPNGETTHIIQCTFSGMGFTAGVGVTDAGYAVHVTGTGQAFVFGCRIDPCLRGVRADQSGNQFVFFEQTLIFADTAQGQVNVVEATGGGFTIIRNCKLHMEGSGVLNMLRYTNPSAPSNDAGAIVIDNCTLASENTNVLSSMISFANPGLGTAFLVFRNLVVFQSGDNHLHFQWEDPGSAVIGSLTATTWHPDGPLNAQFKRTAVPEDFDTFFGASGITTDGWTISPAGTLDDVTRDPQLLVSSGFDSADDFDLQTGSPEFLTAQNLTADTIVGPLKDDYYGFLRVGSGFWDRGAFAVRLTLAPDATGIVDLPSAVVRNNPARINSPDASGAAHIVDVKNANDAVTVVVRGHSSTRTTDWVQIEPGREIGVVVPAGTSQRLEAYANGVRFRYPGGPALTARIVISMTAVKV